MNTIVPNVETAIKNKPPKLAELGLDLIRLTRFQITRAIAIPFLAFASFWILAPFGYWTLATMSLVVLSFVTYGSTSHDLVHRSLGLSRRTNDILLSVIEAISLRSGHAYQVAHLNHHARFPNDDDIEAEAARMSLPRTLLEGFIFQMRIYNWALRHAPEKRNWIISEGITVSLLIIGAAVALPYTIIPFVYVALMIAGSWIIPLVTSYIPHNATANDVLHQTRLFRGLFFRIVAADHLYHLEHHLYQAVPHQNWVQLAQRLDPWFEERGIEAVRIGF